MKPDRLKWVVGAAGVFCAGLLFCQWCARRFETALTVLPLDGGVAAHVKRSGAFRPMLVNCGNVRTFEPVLAEYLHARGENRLQALVLTHGEVRQMGAAPLVLDAFSPAKVAISTVRFRSRPYRELTKERLKAKHEPTRLNSGETFAGWRILHPPGGLKVRRADEGVMVLRGTIRGTRVLLLSDLGREGQRLLMTETNPAQLRADIVVVALPGHGEPLIEDLLRRVQPDLIIVGDAEWPATCRASAMLLARLRSSGSQVLSTREVGAVKVLFEEHGWKALNAAGGALGSSSSESRPGR